MNILIIILLGIALSMDAFSLAISIGMLRFEKKLTYKLVILIGVSHILMTTIGLLVGHIVERYIILDTNIIASLIFIILGLIILKNGFKKEKATIFLNNISIIILSLGVSIDSFMVGIGSTFLTENHLIAPTIFGIISALFSFVGIKLGIYLEKQIGNKAEILSGIIFIIYGFSKCLH